MKKSTFTLFAVILMFGSVQGQKTTFGIKAAFTTNHLSFYDQADDKKIELQRPGFYAGGVLNMKLSKHLALQPNLLVALRGGSTGDIKIATWNISVPVHLLYTHAGFFIGAGPDFSYSLDGRATGNVEPDGSIDIHTNEADPEGLWIKRFVVGANAVMGYTFPNGVSLSANFLHSMHNLNESDDSFRRIIHTKTVGLSVGYFF